MLSPDGGIEEAFKHRSIDLGSRPPKRAFVSAFLFVFRVYRSLDYQIPVLVSVLVAIKKKKKKKLRRETVGRGV